METPKQIELTQPRSDIYKRSHITVELENLAIRRSVELSDRHYEVLVEDLLKFELVDIKAGLEYIGKHKREEGETAFPSLGDMLKEIRYFKTLRLEDEDMKARREEDERLSREAEEYRQELQRERDPGLLPKTIDEEIDSFRMAKRIN